MSLCEVSRSVSECLGVRDGVSRSVSESVSERHEVSRSLSRSDMERDVSVYGALWSEWSDA